MIFREIFKRPLRKKIYLNGTFFDLSKAFYILYHKILLSKLDACGIRGYRKSGSYMSNLQEIKHAVIQGSILGPILFYYLTVFQ
jgi:hypothetical protein